MKILCIYLHNVNNTPIKQKENKQTKQTKMTEKNMKVLQYDANVHKK